MNQRAWHQTNIMIKSFVLQYICLRAGQLIDYPTKAASEIIQEKKRLNLTGNEE